MGEAEADIGGDGCLANVALAGGEHHHVGVSWASRGLHWLGLQVECKKREETHLEEEHMRLRLIKGAQLGIQKMWQTEEP